MNRIILWGTGRQYNSISFDIICKLLEGQIIGITTNDSIDGTIDGIPIINREELKSVSCDYIVVMTDLYPFSKVCKEAIKIGIDTQKFISVAVLLLPGFTIERYEKLRNQKLSIIAPCCFAGYIYHYFRLPFLSPTINLWFPENDYMKLLVNFKKYITSNLTFRGINYDQGQQRIYPIFSLMDDIMVHMNHTTDSLQAEQMWNTRVKRINYDNLLIMNYTKREDILEQFDALPYQRKVCFVPFKTPMKSAWYLPDNLLNNAPCQKELHFGWAVNRWADGRLAGYDLWDLLLYNKKTSRLSLLQ